MWAETEDRTEYTALAEADKAVYQEEMAEYRSNGAVDKSSPPARKIQRSPSESKGTQPSGNKTATGKRAPSAYIIFCRETRSEIVGEDGQTLPLGETTKRLADRWNNMDPSSKAKWIERANEEKEKLVVGTS